MSKEIQPHILADYHMVKQMGSGAYGHVFEVQQKKTKKHYALKKVFDAFRNSVDAQRTYRQVQILKQLQHQNIVKMYKVIKAKNKKDLYLVFQFMETDLHSIVGSNVLQKMHQVYVFYQILKALKYLHSAQLIHRDLKPSNILLNSQCLAKICDFGLIRTLGSSSDEQTILSEQVATKWYRAPELLLGSRSYKKPIDVWSFGCIVAQILTGKPMFSGDSTLNQLQKIMQFTGDVSRQDIEALDSPVAQQLITQIKVKKRSFREYFSSVDPDFWVLLKGSLQFNPNKRMTIDQILELQVFDQFKDEIKTLKVSTRPITLKIDDNIRYGLKVYRDQIYDDIDRRQKVDSQKQTRKLNQTNNLLKFSNQNISKKRVISQDKTSIKSVEKFKHRQYSTGSEVKFRKRYISEQKQKKSQIGTKYHGKSEILPKSQHHSPYKAYMASFLKTPIKPIKSSSSGILKNFYKKNLLPFNKQKTPKIRKIDPIGNHFNRKKSPSSNSKNLIIGSPKNQSQLFQRKEKDLKKVSSANAPKFFSKKNILKTIGFGEQK